jgi:hypothetical protein
MPVTSNAQRKAMYAAKEGRSKIGIPAKVGAEFIRESHGVTGLPARKSGGFRAALAKRRSK